MQQGAELLYNWKALTQSPRGASHERLLGKIFKQIDNCNQNMVRTLGLMEEPVRVAHRQERSAWFSGVGKVSKFLFGTLDEDTEKDIKDLIARNDAKLAKLSKLLVNQTEIVYKEFRLLHDRADAFEKSLIALENEQRKEERTAAFTEAMHILEEQVLQYEILFAAQGAIYPRFVNPAQVQETAELIAKSVSDARFPLSYENGTLADLVKIADLSIMLYDTRLIYYITIPLIGYSQYDLYKASPWPTPTSSRSVDQTTRISIFDRRHCLDANRRRGYTFVRILSQSKQLPTG